MSFSSPPSPVSMLAEELTNLRRVWWLLLILGLVSVVVGLLAISSTFVATLASVVFFGVVLMVAGVAEVVHAFVVRGSRGFALHLLSAALYLIVGFFMLEDPLQSAKIITLMLAAAFVVGGLLRIVFSLAVQFHSWGWVLLNGVVTLLLGILIWRGWPESSFWVIGLFVGIDLLFHGWSWIIMALNVRTLVPPPAG